MSFVTLIGSNSVTSVKLEIANAILPSGTMPLSREDLVGKIVLKFEYM